MIGTNVAAAYIDAVEEHPAVLPHSFGSGSGNTSASSGIMSLSPQELRKKFLKTLEKIARRQKRVQSSKVCTFTADGS